MPDTVEFFALCDVPYPWVPLEAPKTIDIPGDYYDRNLGARALEGLTESARQLERLGFDGAIITEQHGGAVSLISQAMIGAAWIAAHTERLRVAAVGPMLNAYLTPLRLAEEIAMVDNLSGGRLSVGLPMGIGSQYHAYGVTDPTWARDRFREAHDLLIRALTENGPFHFQGDHFEVPYVNLWPRPLQQPYPEIWIPAAGSRESLNLAAEYRHTYMQVLVPWVLQKKNSQLFHELCRQAGYDPDPRQVVWVGSIYVAETDEQARLEFEAAQAWIYQSLGLTLEDAFPPGQVSLQSFRALVENGGYRMGDDSPESMSWEQAVEERWLVAGSPETVTRQLRGIVDELGAGRVVFDAAVMPPWMKEKSLGLMAEHVLPSFRPADGAPRWRHDPGAHRSVAERSAAQRDRPTPAGISGLAAADRLRQQGARVLVLEARSTPGGRVSRIAADGLPRDYDGGGQFVFAAQTEMNALLQRYGLHTEDAYTTGRMVRHFGGARAEIDPTSPPDPAVGAALGKAFGTLSQMAATFPSGSPWTAPDAAEWDRTTFRSWTLQHIDDPVARGIVESQLANALGGSPSQLSLLAVLDFIQSTGGLGLPPKFLGVTGGLFQLPERIAESLGDDILYDAPVSAVSVDQAGVQVTSAKGTVEARAVIIAMSPALVNRIRFQPALPLRRKALGNNWQEIAGIKAVLRYDRPFWREQGLSGMASGDLPAAAFVQDHTAPGQQDGILVAFYNANERADWNLIEDPDARAAARLQSLVQYFGPEAGAPTAVGEYNWIADEWAAGCSYGLNPGVWTQYGPILRTPVGPIFWAGTDTAEQWQGSVEGAARAGVRAADEALARAGQPV